MTIRSNGPLGMTLFLICLATLTLALACGGGGGGGGDMAEPESAEEAPAEGAAAESSDGAPRIFFVTPEDGAEVTSPVHFEFGAENFTIEPRGEGDIHAGAGHHHIGVDTDCLPAGEAIPEADPWVHFGDGSNTIDMQLPPGQHKITIQVGDGMHVALDEPGLCTSITITVLE